MIIAVGIIVWIVMIYLVLRFFAVSAEISKTYEGRTYKAQCPCGHYNEVYHIEWDSIKCSECGMYYEKSEFGLE